MLASSYPLLDVFWTMLWFFLFFMWIWFVVAVFADIIRSHDLSGWGKALWLVAIVIIPFFGVLLYLLIRGGSMQHRSAQQAKAQDDAFREYVKQAAGDGSAGSADQLTKLADLRDRGVITQAEFEAQKSKVLAA